MVRLYFARFGGELNLCNGVFLVVGIWKDAVGGCSRSQNGGVHMWSESKTRSGLPRKKDAAMLRWRSWSGSTEVNME